MWSTIILILGLASTATALPASAPQHPVIRLPLEIRDRQAPTSLNRRQEPLTDVNAYGTFVDAAYHVGVDIGTPPQRMSLLVDTGSAHIAVPGPSCNEDVCRSFSNHTLHSDQSSTFTNLTEEATLGYFKGFFAGHWGQDTVTVGNLTVPENKFLVATIVAKLDTMILGNGILGLSWGSKDPGERASVWESLQNKQFGLWLARRNTTDTNGGSLTLGGFHHEVIDGEIEWLDTVPGQIGEATSGWFLPFDGITYATNANGTEYSDTVDTKSVPALIDSGASMTHGPIDIVQSMYMSIPGVKEAQFSQEWRYSVDPEYAKNFTMSFRFAGKDYAMQPEDLWICTQIKGRCLSTILGDPRKNATWIIGANFMKNYYTAFRADPPAVGFGKLTEAAASLTPFEINTTTTTASTSTATGANASTASTTSDTPSDAPANKDDKGTGAPSTVSPTSPSADGSTATATGANGSALPATQPTSAASRLVGTWSLTGLVGAFSVYLVI